MSLNSTGSWLTSLGSTPPVRWMLSENVTSVTILVIIGIVSVAWAIRAYRACISHQCSRDYAVFMAIMNFLIVSFLLLMVAGLLLLMVSVVEGVQ